MVAEKFQVFMDETSALDLFQSGFGLGFRIKTVLDFLADNLTLHLDKGMLVLLIILDLSVAFSTVDHSLG